MEYKNEELKTSFTLPDKITVRKQLEYFSATSDQTLDMFYRYWVGARTVIEDWKSESLPDVGVALDDLTDPQATAVIVWAGLRVVIHMNRLQEIPKN